MPADTATATATIDAREWLRAQLTAGPARAGEVQALAEAIGISPKTLRTAREELCLPPTRESGRGPWLWELRDQTPDEPRTEENPLPAQTERSEQTRGSRAHAWVTEQRVLGSLTDAETSACRWLIRMLAGGPRRRLEVEEVAVDGFVDRDALRVAVERLATREGVGRSLAAEVWALRDRLPPPPPGLVAAHVRSQAVAHGWTPDPRRGEWLPAAGPDWLMALRESHRRRVDAVAEATRELHAFTVHAAAIIAEHEHELAAAGPVAHALALQATEPERTKADRRRLEAEVARTQAARAGLQRRHEREDAETAALAGRQMRGLSLPDGWEPDSPIFVAEPNRAEQRRQFERAKTAAAEAELALTAHRDRDRRPRVAGLSLTDLA